MFNRLKGLFRGNRPKVIAVIGLTGADVKAGVLHAGGAPGQEDGSRLPVWAWCAEENTKPIEGCDRLFAGAGAWRVRRDLQSAWAALTIVAWTGRRGDTALKLIPFMIPPFRVVVFNEARGFFAARPVALAKHARRRLRDASQSGVRRIFDWCGGAGQWFHSVAYRAGERRRDLAHWVPNAGLALLAFLAQSTPLPAHFALRRLSRGGRPAESPAEVASGGRLVEIEVSNRGWPRGKVVEAVGNADADFIVFRRRGEEAPAEPLIALARETNAFAAARQSAYAGWRRQIVTKHPFRKLQRGEVTQVFAPCSSLIVMRRDMLARFGVPHALTYGAALMVLYWKAAAGMRSLVTGHGGDVTEEPAMALEDAELAARLAVSPFLRGISLARSHRPRGNVAFSPAHGGEFRGKLRVLVVSPYLPFPLAHGGAVRMYNLCRAMSREIDFVLACFREAGETVRYQELHEVFREVYVVDADEKVVDSSVPKQVAEYRNTAMADLIRRLCLDRRVDLVQLEYTQMAEYRDQTGAIPLILVEHDITFTLHEQLARISREPGAAAQYELWRVFEREALQCSNGVWTMPERDRAIALEHGAPRKSTAVVRNGVDLRRFQPLRKHGRERTILFVGSFRHLPNLLAFEALRESVMPAVWLDCPDARLHVIAGPDYARAAGMASKGALLTHDPRITIDGFVEDVRPAYRECDVVAIPLPLSAGTNIKVMEAMACGRAIVSTPSGCQDLDLRSEHDVLVRGLGPEFAAAVVLLMRDGELRHTIAAQARHTAERRFGWDAAAEDALGFYYALTGRPRVSKVSSNW